MGLLWIALKHWLFGAECFGCGVKHRTFNEGRARLHPSVFCSNGCFQETMELIYRQEIEEAEAMMEEDYDGPLPLCGREE